MTFVPFEASDTLLLHVCAFVVLVQIMLTGLVIFSGIGTVCGGIIFQWRRSAANRKANMLKVCAHARKLQESCAWAGQMHIHRVTLAPHVLLYTSLLWCAVALCPW